MLFSLTQLIKRNFRPTVHGNSAKYTNSTSLHDFRTLPAEPDGQIETKVVGPGKLKVYMYSKGYLHARGLSFWLTCLFPFSFRGTPIVFLSCLLLRPFFSSSWPFSPGFGGLVTYTFGISFSFFLPCQFSWCMYFNLPFPKSFICI